MPARSSKRRRALSCRSTRCSELRRGTDEDGGIDPPGDLSWREETFHLSLAWGSVHNRKNGRRAEPAEGHVNRDPSMTGIWWTSVSIEILLCSLTATTAHLLMSLGQTLFHRYLGHRGIGGRFFENHLHIHHRHYSGNHVVSEYYLNKEANNTPFFLRLIPLSQVGQYLGLAGQIQNGAGFE